MALAANLPDIVANLGVNGFTGGARARAAEMNTNVLEPLLWLCTKGNPSPVSDFDGTVSSTSSGSFVDFGSSISLTTVRANAKVLIMAWGQVDIGNSADVYAMTLSIDAVDQGDATRGLLQMTGGSGADLPFCIAYVATIASAGAHTLKLRGKRVSGASGSLSLQMYQMWAQEVA